jgi:hypothetical protein
VPGGDYTTRLAATRDALDRLARRIARLQERLDAMDSGGRSS